MGKLQLGAIIVGALLFGQVGMVATAATFSLLHSGTTSQLLKLNRFNPSLGTLTEVHVTLSDVVIGAGSFVEVSGTERDATGFAHFDAAFRITGPRGPYFFGNYYGTAVCIVPPVISGALGGCSDGLIAPFETDPSFVPNPIIRIDPLDLAEYVGLGTVEFTAQIYSFTEANFCSFGIPGSTSCTFSNDVSWAGTLTLEYVYSPASPLLTGAVSRKTHGLAGMFELPLSLSLVSPTSEPRQGVATVAMTFNKPITGATVTVTEGTAVAGAPTFNGNSVIVGLSGVANAQYVTITLTNVASSDGGSGGNGAVRIGFLVGDVNQSRVVTLSDLGQVNAQVAQPVTAANYLKDVNASGTLSLADKGITNTQLTKALPAP